MSSEVGWLVVLFAFKHSPWAEVKESAGWLSSESCRGPVSLLLPASRGHLHFLAQSVLPSSKPAAKCHYVSSLPASFIPQASPNTTTLASL